MEATLTNVSEHGPLLRSIIRPHNDDLEKLIAQYDGQDQRIHSRTREHNSWEGF
jgi:hypothetical protein